MNGETAPVPCTVGEKDDAQEDEGDDLGSCSQSHLSRSMTNTNTSRKQGLASCPNASLCRVPSVIRIPRHDANDLKVAVSVYLHYLSVVKPLHFYASGPAPLPMSSGPLR